MNTHQPTTPEVHPAMKQEAEATRMMLELGIPAGEVARLVMDCRRRKASEQSR